MQKISFIINGILLVLIGVLFYLFFSTKTTKSEVVQKNGAKIDKSVTIAYVDVDSIQEKYLYFTQKREELKKKAAAMESSYTAKKNDFQKMYENAQNNAPTMTQNQMESIQMKLQEKQAELQNLEATMTDQLDRESAEFNDAFLKKLVSYIDTVNKDNKYAFVFMYSKNSPSLLYTDKQYDITKQVVEGLNIEYNESIKK